MIAQVDYLSQRLLDAAPEQLKGIRNALIRSGRRLHKALGRAGRRPAGRGAALRAAVAPGRLRRRGRTLAEGRALRHPLTCWLRSKRTPSHYTIFLDLLRPVRGELLVGLAAVFRDRERSESDRTWATTVLSAYAGDRPEVLTDLLMDAGNKPFAVLFSGVLSHRDRALPLLNDTVSTPLESKKTDDEKEALAKRQANAAVALLRLGQSDRVWPLLRHSPDPRVRSYLIHGLGPLGAEPGPLVERLEQERTYRSGGR